jgi:hypothetical protein
MRTKILILILLLIPLCVCDFISTALDKIEVDIEEITLRIKGIVSDITDNSPVESATVSLMRIGIIPETHLESVQTDGAGQYSLIYTHSTSIGLMNDEKDFFLKVSATEYKTKKITNEEENHVRFIDEWQTIDIQLEPGSGEMR